MAHLVWRAWVAAAVSLLALVTVAAAGPPVTAAMVAGSLRSHLAAPSTGAPQQSTQALITQANELMRAYDYEAALALTEQAVARAPLDLDANRLLSVLYARLGNRVALRGRYQDLLARFPDSAVVYYLLAGAGVSAELRESYLREALRRDPNFGPAMMAVATTRDPRSSEALSLARRAVDLMPGDSTAAQQYMSLLRRQGRAAEADAFLQQMIAQNPGNLNLLIQKWTNALSRMGRRRDITPLLPEIDANRYRFTGSMQDMERLAGIYSNGGTAGRDRAAQVWLDIAARWPKHPRAEVALLHAADLLDSERSIEILRRLLESYPDSSLRYAIYQRMITNLIREHRTEEAIDLAKEIIEMPDPGFEETGAARDSIARARGYGQSFVCLGHTGWFMAAQTEASEEEDGGTTGVRNIIVIEDGTIVSRSLPRVNSAIVVKPAAAAAARSLRDSTCREPDVLMRLAQLLIATPSYRTLGIELIEIAATAQANAAPAGATDPEMAPRINAQLLSLRTTLAGLYLAEGRIDEAVAMIDTVVASVDDRLLGTSTERTAGQVYEAAGRLQEAKVHYLRAVSTSRRDEEIVAALSRIYRALSSNELQLFDGDNAPVLPLRGIRLAVPGLDVQARLERLLTADLTLVLVWTPSFAASGDQLGALAAIGQAYADHGVATLAIGLGRTTATVARALRGTPVDSPVGIGTFNELRRLGIDELPVTMLVDASGRVWARQMSFGVRPDQWARQWREILDRALAVIKKKD